jgi:Mn-dependent DtxR family transcriptional regulator
LPTKSKRAQKKTAPRTVKSLDERVIARVGKRPIGRNELAEKLGVKPQAVAGPLGRAHAKGLLIKTDRGYQRAI